MPLYKRKVLSQKSNIQKILSPKNENKKKGIFKTPLIQNQISLKDYNSDKQHILLKPNQESKKALTNKQPQKLSPLEFQVNSEQLKDQKDTFIHDNIHKDIDNKEKNISKSLKSKKTKVLKNKKGVPEKNNNERINKKSRRKSKTKADLKANRSNNDLDESIISLWRESNETPCLEPPQHLSYFERLLWLQNERNVGLYVQCDKCDKYRYLKDTADPLDLPDKWYCYMNSDKNYNKCSGPEYDIPIWEEDDLIHNIYNAGSVVWAKVDGYPWWPAMVDDDPNLEMYYWLNEFSDVPESYHVIFFDSNDVTRAWLTPNAISKFKGNIDNPIFEVSKTHMTYKYRIGVAKEQAKNALKLNLADRLKKYSFLTRWKKPINPPKDLMDKEKHIKKKLKYVKKKEIKKVARKSEMNPKKNKFDLHDFRNETESGYGGITPPISPELFEPSYELLNDIEMDFSDF